MQRQAKLNGPKLVKLQRGKVWIAACCQRRRVVTFGRRRGRPAPRQVQVFCVCFAAMMLFQGEKLQVVLTWTVRFQENLFDYFLNFLPVGSGEENTEDD